MARIKAIRGYHPPCVFNANGPLAKAKTGVVGTYTTTAALDAARHIEVSLRIDIVRFIQIIDGNGGTTTVELYRRRAAVNTLLATMSIAQGGGDYAVVTAVPASEALRTLDVGDFLLSQFTSVQTASFHASLQVGYT